MNLSDEPAAPAGAATLSALFVRVDADDALRARGICQGTPQASRRPHFPNDALRKSGTFPSVSRRVELTVGKQVLRLATTAPDEHLVELVSLVEEKLAQTGGAQRANVAEAALMAALALADELVAERGRRSQVEQRARDTVIAAIAHVDEALAHVEAG
jgi:cell division protein ZapA (FtsZ GTPase activity inhibitor)